MANIQSRPVFEPKAIVMIAGVLVGGLLIANDHAVAQQPSEITVVAPHAVSQNVGTTSIGAPILEVSLSVQLGYGDLDLTTQSGVAKLDSRITDVAKHACGQLDKLYPEAMNEPSPPSQDCVKTAVDGAMGQAAVAIAAARK